MAASIGETEISHVVNCLQDKVAVSTLAGDIGLATGVSTRSGELEVVFFLDVRNGVVQELEDVHTRRCLPSELVVIQSSVGIPQDIYCLFCPPSTLQREALEKIRVSRNFLTHEFGDNASSSEESCTIPSEPTQELLFAYDSSESYSILKKIQSSYDLHGNPIYPTDWVVATGVCSTFSTPRIDGQDISSSYPKTEFRTLCHKDYPGITMFSSIQVAEELWWDSCHVKPGDPLIAEKIKAAQSRSPAFSLLPTMKPGDFKATSCIEESWISLREGERLVFDTKTYQPFVLAPSGGSYLSSHDSEREGDDSCRFLEDGEFPGVLFCVEETNNRRAVDVDGLTYRVMQVSERLSKVKMQRVSDNLAKGLLPSYYDNPVPILSTSQRAQAIFSNNVEIVADAARNIYLKRRVRIGGEEEVSEK